MPFDRDRLVRARKAIDAGASAYVVQAEQGQHDNLSDNAELFAPLVGDGALIRLDSIRNFSGTLYRALVDLWDRPDQWPDVATNLWELVTTGGNGQ